MLELENRLAADSATPKATPGGWESAVTARSSRSGLRRHPRREGDPAPLPPAVAEPSSAPAGKPTAEPGQGRLDETIARMALLALAVGCVLVLWPFILPILWAVILSYSTWPLFRRVERRLGGRRTLAAVVARRLEAALHRIAGEQGAALLTVAGGTAHGVVYGILGSCLAQAILAGFGFWLAGVPGALFLGLLTFFLSLIPLGPVLIWLPAAILLFAQGATGWGVFLVIWGLFVVGTIDNVIKPFFISRGGALPFILVLLGVLGGAFAFGFIGIFVGPTLLAVGYSLLKEWSSAETA